jgi:hypothetical protein
MTEISNELSSIEEKEAQMVIVNFDKQFVDLEKALANTKEAKSLAASVENKGGWDSFKGGFSGKNDKEIAEAVRKLGGSLEVTQDILNVVLKANTAKNVHLKGFHQVLVEKVLFLQTNSSKLNSNQNNSNQAALSIAMALKDQIEEKIRHAEMIDNHEREININAKGVDGNAKEIEALKSEVSNKEVLDDKQSLDIESLLVNTQEIKQLDQSQSVAINELQDQVANLQQKVANNEKTLEELHNQHNLRGVKFIRLVMPLIATCIASAALYLTLMK